CARRRSAGRPARRDGPRGSPRCPSTRAGPGTSGPSGPTTPGDRLAGPGQGPEDGVMRVQLRDVDDAALDQLLRTAVQDAAAHEVTPPLTSGPAWTAERIDWFLDHHRRARCGVDGPAGEATWAVMLEGRPRGARPVAQARGRRARVGDVAGQVRPRVRGGHACDAGRARPGTAGAGRCAEGGDGCGAPRHADDAVRARVRPGPGGPTGPGVD